MFRSESLSTQQGLLILGSVVAVSSLAALRVRFPAEVEDREEALLRGALLAREEAI